MKDFVVIYNIKLVPFGSGARKTSEDQMICKQS